MKSLNTLIATAALTLASSISFPALAQTKPAAAPMADMKMEKSSASADMTEGEIRKVDKGTKKITIKHGEIKNLDMPGMTMLFQVKEPAMLDMVKAGDKVKFKVEKMETGLVVTEIQVAK
jgi:Cu(I)/Ag(I) efflux system protein CusF